MSKCADNGQFATAGFPTPVPGCRPPPPMAICTKDCIGMPSNASDGDGNGGGPGAEYLGCQLGTAPSTAVHRQRRLRAALSFRCFSDVRIKGIIGIQAYGGARPRLHLHLAPYRSTPCGRSRVAASPVLRRGKL
jgi:hypothetical protein